MGATGAPKLRGGSGAQVRAVGKTGLTFIPVTFTMSASYSTGGDTLTLPTADIRGKELVGVMLLTPSAAVGTDRVFAWNGSTAAPKITSRVISSAAETDAATDLSAVTHQAILIYEG